MNKAILGTFKSAETSKGVMIEGWANKAVVDRDGDLIPKEAWRLENFTKNPIILFNHDRSQPIGRAVITEARDDGLYVKAKISQSETPDIARVRDLIKEGVMNAFSVGFDMRSSEEGDGHNVIKEAELFEISVVSIPANADSVFSLTKKYDYDRLKELCKNEAPSDDNALAETETQEPESKADEVAYPKAAAIGLAVQAVLLSKDRYKDLGEAEGVAKDIGYAVEEKAEDENYYVFEQEKRDLFLSLADSEIGNGLSLRLGVKLSQEKSLTVALPTDAPPEDDSVELMQMKQTNVMLGLVVSELQSVRDAILALAASMPPKPAPVDVEVEDEEESDNVAQEAEIVREYMAAIQKTLARIGA